MRIGFDSRRASDGRQAEAAQPAWTVCAEAMTMLS